MTDTDIEIRDLSLLTPSELEAALAERPLAYVPCGLVEWHGQHLPLGLDGLKIQGILRRCVAATGGVLLPINWIGAPGFGAFCGTLTHPPELVRQLLTLQLAQCAKLGARVIALVTGHYGSCQVETVTHAAADFAAEHPGIRVLVRPEYEGVEVSGSVPADHAGKWETSMALALFPEHVHMDRHRPGEEAIVRYGEEHAVWDAERRPWVWSEDLRLTASAELGERAVGAIVERITADVEALCREAGI
jgi:creatinine amidohydrolase